MDSTLLTAIAAGLGSMAGASATIVTTFLTQRTQAIRANAEWKLRVRETLYGEFITEASRVSVDALLHSLDRPEQLVALYGILSRIRLVAGADVLRNAEICCRRIVKAFRQPNMTADQIRDAFDANELDPLKEFSAACRAELSAMSSNAPPDLIPDS
ncbi:MAG TPA: hypothetical protein VND64_25035 [Pirellulales bacterium]|nr:hypothetical protein [Pirellulales bacterium]